MRMDGTHVFAAAPGAVWAVLTDPAALARCTPGCKALRQTGPDRYELDLELGVAAIKGSYTGTLALENIRPPAGYDLVIAAQGGPGWMQGRWSLGLQGKDGGTELSYGGEMQVGGLIAGVGQRVLGGVAKMVMGQLFAALAKEMQA